MRIKRNVTMCGYDIFLGDIDICNLMEEKKMDYFKLPKDDQWIENGNPYEVGGRNTDIAQIAYSLNHRARELFTINEVPIPIVNKLKMLEEILIKGEKEIQETINLISDYMCESK